MKSLFEALNEMSMPEIKSLEQRLDDLFGRIDIDVQFSKHFKDRLQGREKDLEPQEVYDAFTKFLRAYGGRVYKSRHLEGVLHDLNNDVNIPFSIDLKRGGGKKLTTITVMRKRDFKTYDEEFRV